MWLVGSPCPRWEDRLRAKAPHPLSGRAEMSGGGRPCAFLPLFLFCTGAKDPGPHLLRPTLCFPRSTAWFKELSQHQRTATAPTGDSLWGFLQISCPTFCISDLLRCSQMLSHSWSELTSSAVWETHSSACSSVLFLPGSDSLCLLGSFSAHCSHATHSIGSSWASWIFNPDRETSSLSGGTGRWPGHLDHQQTTVSPTAP